MAGRSQASQPEATCGSSRASAGYDKLVQVTSKSSTNAGREAVVVSSARLVNNNNNLTLPTTRQAAKSSESVGAGR